MMMSRIAIRHYAMRSKFSNLFPENDEIRPGEPADMLPSLVVFHGDDEIQDAISGGWEPLRNGQLAILVVTSSKSDPAGMPGADLPSVHYLGWGIPNAKARPGGRPDRAQEERMGKFLEYVRQLDDLPKTKADWRGLWDRIELPPAPVHLLAGYIVARLAKDGGRNGGADLEKLLERWTKQAADELRAVSGNASVDWQEGLTDIEAALQQAGRLEGT